MKKTRLIFVAASMSILLAFSFGIFASAERDNSVELSQYTWKYYNTLSDGSRNHEITPSIDGDWASFNLSAIGTFVNRFDIQAYTPNGVVQGGRTYKVTVSFYAAMVNFMSNVNVYIWLLDGWEDSQAMTLVSNSTTATYECEFAVPASYKGVGQLQIDFAVDLGSTGGAPLIKFGKPAIVSNGENDAILDEDYGYTEPDAPNTDDGLAAGGNLLDQMVEKIDDFNANININTQVLIDNVNRVKPILDGIFGVIPLPVTATITGVVVFLVLRKVVGR